MRWLAIVGVVLIVLGIAGLVIRVIPIRHTEQVAKIGPIVATQVQETDYAIPTIAGVIAVLADVALISADRRKT
jgi:hypothetical protein